MRRAVVTGVTCLLVGGVGYATADVVDLAPGILTYDGAPVSPPTPSGSPSASPTWIPLPSASPAPSGVASPTPSASPPSAAGLARALAPLVADPWLGPGVAVSVRDGETGTELYAVNATAPRAPASTLKVLSALAIAENVDLDARMVTKVVTGARPNELVLVAGGDTLLGTGTSVPSSVEGRAGVATLADEVAQSLTDRASTGPLTLRVDATYAAGPRHPPSWKKEDIAAGFTQSVSMLDLVSQRAGIGRAAPATPENGVAAALAKALTARGHATTAVPLVGFGAAAPQGATELGAVESATYAEHLGVALRLSDNALTENLVRQAMVASGLSPAAPLGPPQFVVTSLAEAGVPTAGLRLLDTSGLSPGQTVTAAALAEVLSLATTGELPAVRRAVAELPVAGLSGSLSGRYRSKETRAVAGIPRAKTGTLRGISSLAGTTVDADGRLLSFVVMADRVPPSSGTLGARAALDRFVAALTQCGCP